MNLSIIVVTCIFAATEFRYNWCEKLIGSFLATTNRSRPETGAIWETGEMASNAKNNLKEIVSKQNAARQHVQKSTSFMEIARGLMPGEWINIEKEHFKKLYVELSDPLAEKLLNPVKMLWLLNGPDLDRIFIEGEQKGIRIYFLDADNKVLKRIGLDMKLLERFERKSLSREGSLEDFKGFKDRIYEAAPFFRAVLELPQDMIGDLISNPSILLKEKGRIVRAGIWNEAKEGYIRLGFEFVQDSGHKVVFVKGREWAVWQLSINLKEENR
ncbi:MAG: hypothetical protein R6V41_13300 [Desulfobacteraceae bacterium]